MNRRRRAQLLSLAITAGGVLLPPTTASEIIAQGGDNLDLNLGAFVIAIGTLLAGIVGYLRLRADRPQIMATIEKLDAERKQALEETDATREERLQRALDAAWQEAERLRAIRELERIELDRCHQEIATLRSEVSELRGRLAASLERGRRRDP